MQKILTLLSAGGVAFNQLKDGSIRCFINPQNAEGFRRNVLKLADEIGKYLVEHLESQKEQELSKHELPLTRIQTLEAELARLKAEDPTKGFPSVTEMTFPQETAAPVSVERPLPSGARKNPRVFVWVDSSRTTVCCQGPSESERDGEMLLELASEENAEVTPVVPSEQISVLRRKASPDEYDRKSRFGRLIDRLLFRAAFAATMPQDELLKRALTPRAREIFLALQRDCEDSYRAVLARSSAYAGQLGRGYQNRLHADIVKKVVTGE